MVEPAGQDAVPASIADRVAFAAALTSLREGAGLSVRDLARAVDLPLATVGGYVSGRHLPPVSQLPSFVRLVRALGVPDGQVDGWIDALGRIRRTPGPAPAGRTQPYPGLRPFTQEDSPHFFGRAAEVDGLLAMIDQARRQQVRMVIVVGPSGSGKSSLLHAGLIPAAVQRGMSVAALTPGAAPTEALASALSPDDPTGPAPGLLVVDQAEELFTLCGPEQRADFLGQVTRLARSQHAAGPAPASSTGQGAGPVVVLGLRADYYGAAARESRLVRLLQHSQFLVGPLDEQGLRAAITGPAAACGVHVEESLVRVLLADLAPAGVSSASQEAGALPLLAHALRVTWERSRRGRMTVQDYQAAGGIAGAVEQSAERVYADLGLEEQRLARTVLLRMVQVGDGASVSRRPARLSDLRGLTQPDAGASATEVVDHFVAARLLTVDTDIVQLSHEALLTAWTRLRDWIDADRAGIRVHRQLADATAAWLAGDRKPSFLLVEGRLAAIDQWIADDGPLFTGEESEFLEASRSFHESARARDRARRRRLQLVTAVAVVLAVTAAVLAVVSGNARAVADRQRAAATQARGDATSARDEADKARDQATRARDEAQSRLVAGEADRLRATDPNLAAQLALAAYRIAPTVEATSAVLNSTATRMPTRMLGTPGTTPLALDADRNLLAVGNGTSGTVTLWSVRTPHQPAELSVTAAAPTPRALAALAFSPDHRILVTADAGGAIRLSDTSDPSHPVQQGAGLTGLPSGALTVAISPDGHTIAAAGAGGKVLRWNITDPAHPTSLAALDAPDTLDGLAYAPDGEHLLGGGVKGDLRLWNTSTGQIEARAATGPTEINTVAVSPDGRTVAIGNRNKDVHLYARSGSTLTENPLAIPQFGGWVNTVAFSPDGRTLVVGSGDNTCRLIDITTGATIASLPHPAPVGGVALLPGGAVVTTATDGTTRIWDVPGPVLGPVGDSVFSAAWTGSGRLVIGSGGQANRDDIYALDALDQADPRLLGAVSPTGGARLSGTVDVSPDGNTLAAGTGDGHVLLWDISDPERAKPVGAPVAHADKIIETVRFSPDGRLLAAGGDDGAVSLWALGAGAEPIRLSMTPMDGGPVYWVAISPDSHTMAVALTAAQASKGNVGIWNISDPAHPVMLARPADLPGEAYTVGFSRDGKTLMAAGTARSVRRWDVTDLSHPVTLGTALTGPGNDIYSVADSPDGKTLAAASADGTVWLYSLDPDPALLAQVRPGQGQLFNAVWARTGSRLAVMGSDRMVQILQADPSAAAAETCRSVGGAMTAAEWSDHVQGRPYLAPCG